MAEHSNVASTTAVTTGRERLESALTPEARAIVEQNRARNRMVAAIRGTLWGKDLPEVFLRSVAEYCRQNQLDAVRHVEILGGRIYLTAEFYDERGAHLIRDGIIKPLPVDFIHVDERLEKLANDGDEWAKQERERRLRERIKHAAPEAAKATAVHRFEISSSGAVVEGVNWCGGGTRKKMRSGGQLVDADPIGDLEPTKTAETRARRRAWRKIAQVLPSYGTLILPVETSARTALPVAVVEREDESPAGSPASNIGPADDPYMLGSGDASAAPASNVTDVELLREDQELVAQESSQQRPPENG
jgi:hypothetical protein